MSVSFVRSPEVSRAAQPAEDMRTVRGPEGWSPEKFAREQIRGLVRQVFFSSVTCPVKQVVLSAAESGTDVGSICRQVGETLALYTEAGIAVVSGGRQVFQDDATGESGQTSEGVAGRSWQHRGTRIQNNLWLIPETGIVNSGANILGYSRICELRQEFEYSIVHAPPAGESSEAAALGQLADGIILVLCAHSTRRATARKIKETLEAAQTRLLGTILTERTFPVPEGIYRRL